MTAHNHALTHLQKTFLTYVRTIMFSQINFRHTPANQPVYISKSEIERLFYPLIGKQIDEEIQSLVDHGELEVSIPPQKKYITCIALRPGSFDLSLVIPNAVDDKLMQSMKQHLRQVSLRSFAPSTEYFDIFLKYKEKYLDLFFKVDNFSGRVHTPVTSFKSDYRKNILIAGETTCCIDVCTMQPLLLGKVLKETIGKNEYSEWIDSGEDIYLKLKSMSGIQTRDIAKKRFFEILFAHPNNDLAKMFGHSNWINWVNEYKRKHLPSNPHSSIKPHSNLAWLLQKTEVELMRKVWNCLLSVKIPFLSVHDEIIVSLTNQSRAEIIMQEILGQFFPFFKLSIKVHDESVSQWQYTSAAAL